MALKVEPVNRSQELFKPQTVDRQCLGPQTAGVDLLPPKDKNLFLGQHNLGAETLKLSLFARYDVDGGGGGGTPAAGGGTPGTVDDTVSQGWSS